LLAGFRPGLVTTRFTRAVRSRRSQISTATGTSPCVLLLLRSATSPFRPKPFLKPQNIVIERDGNLVIHRRNEICFEKFQNPEVLRVNLDGQALSFSHRHRTARHSRSGSWRREVPFVHVRVWTSHHKWRSMTSNIEPVRHVIALQTLIWTTLFRPMHRPREYVCISGDF
jgi:hypothetical protein